MYDVADVTDLYSAPRYVEAATEALRDIVKRGQVPVLFGGAAMYMEWLLAGGGGLPLAREDRDAVEAELRALGTWDAALAHVREALPSAAVAALGRNDYYRLARAVLAAQLGTQPAQGFGAPALALDYRGAVVYPADRHALMRSVGERGRAWSDGRVHWCDVCQSQIVGARRWWPMGFSLRLPN